MNRAWRHTFPLTALFPSAIPVGSQRVRAICPDPKHAETHPSCVVNYNSTHGWRWHCFSCGADGDALDVLTGREGMSFREALGVLTGASVDRGSQMAEGLRGAEPSSPAGNTLRQSWLEPAGLERGENPRHVGDQRRSVPSAAFNTAGSSPVLTVICDACRNETAEFSKRRYGRDARTWTASADLELACLGGWETSAGLQYFIGPKCLERIGA